MWRKWKERDAAKLRKLQREQRKLVANFEALKTRFEYVLGDVTTLRREVTGLNCEVSRLRKEVEVKEVKHVQVKHVKVTVDKPFDYDGWWP